MTAESELFIGLMSGTSLDGVDAALVSFAGGRPKCVATAYLAYPEDLRQELLALGVAGVDELRRAAVVGNRLAELYANAVSNLGVAGNPGRVRAIGCHGQTVRHAPNAGYSIQLNNPALLAELTGIAVVADFRSRDIAAGGQGAPLVPAFHNAVFGSTHADRLILNLGGISNLTRLGRDGSIAGFDCGPGNMLLDAWAQRHLGRPYDESGAWAASGNVVDTLLSTLLHHEFFALPPPKSCGREQFGLDWLLAEIPDEVHPADVQATLVELTATSVIQAIDGWCNRPDEVFLCGGGAHNSQLIQSLKRGLPGIRIAKTDELGLPADWVEAVAFAWLARQTLLGQPGNLPEVTGARGGRILGGIFSA